MQILEDKLKIIWNFKVQKLSDLKEWNKNPRKITENDYKDLLEKIKRDGFHDILKVDTDGTILSGHQRKKALIELGIQEIGTLYPDHPLSEDEKERVSISSNNSWGTYDWDILGNQFEIENLLESGFEEYQLGFIGESP